MFRKDRCHEISGKTKRGRVVLALKNIYSAKQIRMDFSDRFIDTICVKVNTSESNLLYVILVYIDSACNVDSVNNIFNFLKNSPFLYDNNFSIMGDFNISKLNQYYKRHILKDQYVTEFVNF